MVPNGCLICCRENFPKKTATQDAAGRIDNGDTELKMIFLLRKLLEIPEETCCKLCDHFGNARAWIECCDSCLDLVEKCKAALEQAELFQKQFEELRSNIKTTMLKSPKKPFSAESKCEAIVRSILITQEIDNFISTTHIETDAEVVPEGNANFVSDNLTAVARSQDREVLIGSITPVLFEMINTVKSEDETSFNGNDEMDCNLKSTDFPGNIQSSNRFVCHQNNCEIVLSKKDNVDQFVVSPKLNESPRGSKSSLNTRDEEEPRDRRGGKGDAEKKHECHVCVQLFKLPEELRNHVSSHSSTETDKNAFSKGTELLRKPRSKHTGEKKHKCDICGKSFTMFYKLKIHERIHSGERPFVCEICGKRFIEADKLNRHCKVHSGERPFGCDVCGKAFIRKDHLKKHQAIHSEKKPCKCDICDTSFKHKRSLRQHRKMHDEETS